MKAIKRLQIGKKGLTPEIIEQIRNFFEKEKLVKISLLKSSTRKKEEAIEIGDKLINALGKNFTYKIIGFTLIVQKWRKAKR